MLVHKQTRWHPLSVKNQFSKDVFYKTNIYLARQKRWATKEEQKNLFGWYLVLMGIFDTHLFITWHKTFAQNKKSVKLKWQKLLSVNLKLYNDKNLQLTGWCIQLRESKISMDVGAQAHKSSPFYYILWATFMSLSSYVHTDLRFSQLYLFLFFWLLIFKWYGTAERI